MQLGASDLGTSVDENLPVDAADALQTADIEYILGAAIARMLAVELTVSFLLGPRPLSYRRILVTSGVRRQLVEIAI